MSLDLAWVTESHVNLNSTLRRVEWLAQKRVVKMTWQAAWLLRAVTLVDLTTLQGDDTPGNVARLCAKAKTPVRLDILEKLGFTKPITVGAVCVYPARVADAVKVRGRNFQKKNFSKLKKKKKKRTWKEQEFQWRASRQGSRLDSTHWKLGFRRFGRR